MTQTMKAAIGVVALVALGFSLGVGADRLWFRPAPPAETQDMVRARLIEDLRQTVDLSDDQLAGVHQIMNRYQVIVSGAWDDVHPELEQALHSAFLEISGILDPQQTAAFHEWFAQTHSREGVITP